MFKNKRAVPSEQMKSAINKSTIRSGSISEAGKKSRRSGAVKKYETVPTKEGLRILGGTEKAPPLENFSTRFFGLRFF